MEKKTDTSLEQNIRQRYFTASTHMSMGNLEREQSNYDAALDAFEQARIIFESIGKKSDAYRARLDIASVYADLGKYDEAETIYLTVIEMFQQLAQPKFECVAIGNLGNIYKDQGMYAKAIRCYEHAIAFYKKINDKRNQTIFLGNMAIVYQQKGDLDTAIALYEQAYLVHQEYEDLRGQAIVLGNLGTVYQQQNQYQLALDYCLRSRKLFQQLSDKKNTAIFTGNCGEIFLHLKDEEKGVSFLEQAIAICDEIFPIGAGVFRGTLGLFLAEKGAVQRALEVCIKGEKDVLSYPLEHAKFLCKKARILLISDKQDEAQKYRKQAETIAIELGVQKNSGLAVSILALREEMEISTQSFLAALEKPSG